MINIAPSGAMFSRKYMNYAVIKKFDIANGPGVRVSLFVSGCRHFCKN